MNVQCHACIGGTNLGEDIRKLDYGQHVVSGTPGRVFGTTYFSSLYPPVHNMTCACPLFILSMQTTVILILYTLATVNF